MWSKICLYVSTNNHVHLTLPDAPEELRVLLPDYHARHSHYRPLSLDRVEVNQHHPPLQGLQSCLLLSDNVMQNCTRHDNCWGKGVVHLKRLEKQGPPACFHHSKRPLNYGASLGMVVIEAGLHSPLHWLPVWSNNGHRMNDAGVASIPQKEVSLWRIQCIFIHLAVSQDSSVVDRTRISHKNIKEPALPITNCLHLNGWEEFSIDVVLASGSSGVFMRT